MIRIMIHAFRTFEIVYSVPGAMLCGTALIALVGAGAHLRDALQDWSATSAIFAVIGRLLLLFMLIEILHTIRTSMRSRKMTGEPFLIVALIAEVRRILVTMLQSAGVAHDATWTPEREMCSGRPCWNSRCSGL